MGLFRNYLKKDTKTPNQSPVQSIQQSGNASEYTFDVVGESFQRDHLVQLIKNNNSAENGELFTTATLELESDNLFDSTAVVVVIQNLKVGYIPKSQSAIVTDYIKS